MVVGEGAMASALDVAQCVYNEMGWVDSWRLQKLTYYAEAWHLAWFGTSLVDDCFEAWVDGPVCPVLYRENKSRTSTFSSDLRGANAANLSIDQRAVVNSVLDFYGGWCKQQLIEKTHGELPWVEAREGLGKHAYSDRELSRETMMRFYRQQEACGDPVPVRPPEAARSWSGKELQACFDKNVDRWSEAITLLADR